MQDHYPKLFELSDKKSQALPVYVLRDGRLFRTTFHPKGWSEEPKYSLEPDGKFYRTAFHELGQNKEPDYEFGPDMLLYQAQGHPLGRESRPVFELKD